MMCTAILITVSITLLAWASLGFPIGRCNMYMSFGRKRHEAGWKVSGHGVEMAGRVRKGGEHIHLAGALVCSERNWGPVRKLG